LDGNMSIAADRTPTRLAVDHEGNWAEVELASGLVVASALSGRAAGHDGDVGRSDYDPESREATITFRWGESVIFDIGPVEHPNVPVVYLDQNHWVMLACQQWSPEKVPTSHRDGYARLTKLARERAIVLPLSGAHAVETARTDRRWRRDLATTMLQLSRGWQMRGTLKVRREELICALAGYQGGTKSLRPRPVFTLDPDALFGTSDYAEESSPTADLRVRLTWASVLADVMIEDEREDDDDARAKAERWATTYAEIGIRLGESNASREEKRISAWIALLADFKEDVAGAAMAVGLDRGDLENWMEDSQDAFAAMPAIGRIHEITQRRLSNPQHPWRVNDLSDMHFLACAAGYADYLLAEKATSHDLRCAEGRVPSGARICRSPGELVDLIEEQLGNEHRALGSSK
jgi:hypothetical protein